LLKQPNGIKTVPQDLHLSLNAEALAVWFMDDGGRNSAFGSGMIIDVSNFSKSCQLSLQKLLLKNFHLETTFMCDQRKM
jgi:LAGLIDADG DNA endonuclease family